MNRFGNRFVSIALAAIMIIFALPLSALAQEPLAADYSCDTTAYDINSDIDQKAVAKEMEEKAGLGILEIESLREESSKHFQLEDGSYQAIAYGMAVHRKDANGKWQDIDNRLYNDPNAEDRYSTDDGRFSFASVSSSNTLYAVNDGEYTISFGLLLEGMSPSNAMIENHPDRLAIAQSLEGKEKLEALINIDTTTKVVYNQILENMNLEYVITGNDIKEDIILSSPINVEGVAFSMSLNGLYAELSEDGHIKLIDDKDGKEIYSIAAPYMYDAAGEESWDIAYTITESNGVYTIGLVVDDEWIHDSDRVFPVVIDPSLTKTITTDTYISSGSPSINYGSSTELWVSSSKITYMKASMPTLPTYGKITYATLTAKYYFSATSGSMDIGLHRCMRSWSETSLTWNTANSWTNKGLESTESAAATATASSGMSSTNPGTVSFSITSLVKGWYAGNSNYGVGLKYKNGSLSSVRLHSRESTSSYRPYFSITYSVISNPVIQNGTYFLENKKTGRYIDVEDNQFSEGAYTHQWEFLGISSQKWLISYTHDANYYTIKAASSSSFYMRVKDDSPNADIRIVLSEGLDSNSTKTLTNGMIWDFSKTSSGAYKIGAKVGESNNRVLAVGSYILNINGIDVEQRNYSNNTDYIDEWLPYKISGNNDMFVAITSSGHDHVSAYDTLFGYFYEYGRNNFNFINTSYISSNSCLFYMENAKFFVCRCHGGSDSNSTWIKLFDSGTASRLYSYQIYNNNPLADFSGMQIAIYAACETGKNSDTGKNIVDASVNAGASYAIGFNDEIYCSDANKWVEYFFYYYFKMGYSVSYSCTKATSKVSSMAGKCYLAS